MFLCRIQLNHPYTHKRHRFLPARASRRKSAPLVTSSETRRPTGFGETIAKIPVNIDRCSCLGVKGPSRQRAPEQTPLFLPIFCADERSDERERERREKANAPHREGAQIRCRSVPSKHNTRITCRRTCSVKFIYGLRIGVGAFEPPAGWYRGRAGICERYAFYACMRRTTIPAGCPFFHLWDTPNRFGQLSIVIGGVHLHGRGFNATRITARYGIMRVRRGAVRAAGDERSGRIGDPLS